MKRPAPTDHLPKRTKHAAVDHRGRITALVADGPSDPTPGPDDDPTPDPQALATARENAFWWAAANQMTAGKDEAEAGTAAIGIVEAMSDEELMDQFANGIPEATPPTDPQPRMTVTPINSGTDLMAKITELKERQKATPAVERMAVKVVTASGEVEVDMAVKWDDDAFDPYKWDAENHRFGAKGAFVSTLPQSMTAAGADAPQLVDNPGAAWHAILCVEGLKTDEDPAREIVPDACNIPDLPVSLRLQIHDEGGHWGAVTCGRIDTMERQPLQGYNAMAADGVFGTDEHGQTGQLLVDEQTQRFISIDPRDLDMEVIEITIAQGDPWDDEPDILIDYWLRYTSLTIGAATIVATPALQQAVITLADVPLPETPIAVANAQEDQIILLAAGGPAEPPAAWFDSPGFHVGDARLVRQPDGKYACPLTVTDDGQVFGHVCYWGQRHTAFPGQIVTPPRSKTAYAHYMTGSCVDCAEGKQVFGIGQITMGCGHASTSKTLAAAKAHYDGGFGAVQMADVKAGEDDFGVWIAGSLRPGLSVEDVRKFKATNLSGDWRGSAGNLEMIAVLAGVPVQGFPIARQESMVASAEYLDAYAQRTGFGSDGQLISLVAAGRVHRAPVEERLAIHDRLIDDLYADYRKRQMAGLAESLSDLVDL